MPIRVRLTLWYTCMLGAILIAFSIVLYLVLRYSLHNQVDTNLKERSQQVGAAIQSQAVIRQSGEVVGIEVPTLDVFSSSSIFIQVIQVDGNLVLASENLGKERFPTDNELLQANRDNRSIYKTISIDNTSLRIYSAPIALRSGVVGAIQVGQSLKYVEDTLRQVLVFMSGGIIAALILAILVGAFLARTSLRPIERINQMVTQVVGAQDLNQRLPTSNTNDEINSLTMTINGMLERLDNFFQAQVRLSADVSHELRTPLTIIRGNVELLRQGGTTNNPNELNEALSFIDGELDRMSRLVADLLLLAQADAGLSLRRQSVKLNRIVFDVYRQVQVITKEVNIKLGHEDQAVILGDPDRLNQLLLNLVINAIKHTSAGGYVTLSLYQEPEWVRVNVADTGQGIEPTTLPHIFERFYWEGAARGTGLGLSIAQWIAQAHGGQISVTSELRKGSVFTLWLPTEEAEYNSSEPRSLKLPGYRPYHTVETAL